MQLLFSAHITASVQTSTSHQLLLLLCQKCKRLSLSLSSAAHYTGI